MSASLPNPFFINPDNRWDSLYSEADLWKAIFDDPLPAFLADPSPEYMQATEIEQILGVLSRFN